MNIFWLDENLEKSASYLADQHVVKMPIESLQLLCSVHHHFVNPNVPYKPTHMNHPCSVWARDSAANYQLLFEYAIKIGNEYERRYKKEHKSWLLLSSLPDEDCYGFRHNGLTSKPLCMPEKYHSDDVISSYRHYYACEKSHLRW